MARESVALAQRSMAADAKLALVDVLLKASDVTSGARSAAEWLLAHGGAERAIFAATDHSRGSLTAVAGAGVSQRQWKRLSLPLDDSAHPLIKALTNRG